MSEGRDDDQSLMALNRIVTALAGTHWHTGHSIEELRTMINRGVRVAAAAHRQVDKEVVQALDSLSPLELDKLIDRLDLPAKFPEARLE